MGKGKYLIFIITIFASYHSLSSAWLPTLGSYKYSITTLINDKLSRSLAHERAMTIIKIEEVLNQLIQLKYSILSEPNPNNILITLIDLEVRKLKEHVHKLSSFPSQKLIVGTLEYGINNDCSFGLEILGKKQKFIKSDNIYGSKNKSLHTGFSIFYKYKLFEKNSHLITIASHLTLNNAKPNKEEYYYQLSLMKGSSKQTKLGDIYTETGVLFNNGFSKSCKNRSSYAGVTSGGVKLAHGITLSNYTKYSFNKNYGEIYNNVLYEELAISKSFSCDKFKDLNLKLGYYWNKSLVKSKYRVHYRDAGLIFSMAIETW